MKKLNVNAIRIDGATQAREAINQQAVQEYAEAIREGATFPPLVVFFDGADYWLADGFHRWHAHRAAEKTSIAAEVREGTQRDAVLYSLGANAAHGLRRTNADKRKAVQTMLDDAEWSQWSDRKIAEACGVSHPFVAAMRRPEVVTVTTPKAAKAPAQVAQEAPQGGNGYHPSTPAPAVQKATKAPARTLDSRPAEIEELNRDDELAELRDTVADLASENEQLRDKLAVEAMDGSEEAKTEAAETIRTLRARVTALEAEVDALKVSRDTYMREATEAKKQVTYWRKQAEKAGKVAA